MSKTARDGGGYAAGSRIDGPDAPREARPWYVIRAKPQSDNIAADSLKCSGFDVFFPRVRVSLARGRGTIAPLFPGYLFVRYDPSQREWPSAQHLPGVLGWVRFDGAVPPVENEVIADLRRRVEAVNERGGLWTRFRPGDKVLVVSGKMDTLAEVVEEPKSPESRVRVLLEFMGRRVSAQVPTESLRAVREDRAANHFRRRLRRTRGRGRWIRGLGPQAAATA